MLIMLMLCYVGGVYLGHGFPFVAYGACIVEANIKKDGIAILFLLLLSSRVHAFVDDCNLLYDECQVGF